MLPGAQRLRRRRDFQQVYARGRSFADPLLVLHVLPTAGRETRFGFSISKKLGKAVQRNRIRRRLREACRLRLPAIKPGFDIVLVGRSRAREASYAMLLQSVDELLQRARLFVTD